MITSDSLVRYVALRASLLKEKAEIEARLVRINQALGDSTTSEVAAPVAAQLAAAPRSAPVANPGKDLSMREAVLQVTAARPMKVREIMDGLVAMGYKFTVKNPLNSLRSLLYNSKDIRRGNGKFSPA